MESTNIATGAVNSIRPDALHAGHMAAIRQDEEWLKTKQSHFESGNCPLCDKGAPAKKAYSLKNGLVYNRCANCATLFLAKRPTPEIYREYYQNSANMRFFMEHIYPQSRNQRISGIYEPRLNRLCSYINGGGYSWR